MHELSVTQELVQTVEKARLGAGEDLQVTIVNVKIGRLTTVVPEYMTFYFNMLTKEMPGLAGAALEIEIVPITAHCKSCDAEFTVDEPHFVCPACHGENCEITGGREMVVDSIEVAEVEALPDGPSSGDM